MSELDVDASEHGVGLWVGLAIVAIGLVLVIGFYQKDAAALGGSGLIVAGALAAALSFREPPRDD